MQVSLGSPPALDAVRSSWRHRPATVSKVPRHRFLILYRWIYKYIYIYIICIYIYLDFPPYIYIYVCVCLFTLCKRCFPLYGFTMISFDDFQNKAPCLGIWWDRKKWRSSLALVTTNSKLAGVKMIHWLFGIDLRFSFSWFSCDSTWV